MLRVCSSSGNSFWKLDPTLSGVSGAAASYGVARDSNEKLNGLFLLFFCRVWRTFRRIVDSRQSRLALNSEYVLLHGVAGQFSY